MNYVNSRFIFICLFLLCFGTSRVQAAEIHEAAREGKLDVVKRLLEQKRNLVDEPDMDYKATPLYWACLNNQAVIVEMLIDKGAKVNAMADDGNTPLHYASTMEIAELLIESGADVNARVNKTPHRLKPPYIVLGVDWTPLQRASYEGRRDVVAILIEKGGTMNPKTQDGRSPLYLAVQGNHKKVVELLLNKGADVNMKNNDGSSSLHWPENLEITRLLLEKGAGINVRDNDGATPLHMAARIGKTNIIEILIQKGADVKVRSKNGDTPLHETALNFNSDAAEYLISKGAEVNARNSKGETTFGIANRKSAKEFATVLQKHGGQE